MTFAADFNGTLGTKLTALAPPFVLLSGTDDVELNGSGSVRRSVSGTANTAYATYNDGAASQSVSADMANTSVGIFVFGSVNGQGQLSCYYLRPQTGATSARLWKIINGGSPVQLAVSSAIADGVGLSLEVSLNGEGNPVLVGRRQGVQIATFTDTTAEKLTSGRRGIVVPSVTAITTSSPSPLDNYVDNSSAGTSTNLTMAEKPAGFVFEAWAGPPAIGFAGTKPTSVGALERQIETDDGTVISAWSTVGLTTPTTTSWKWDNATLPARLDGKDYRLIVREIANPSNLLRQSNTWGVGLVIPYNDQSLDTILSQYGTGATDAGKLTSVRANNCRVLDTQDKFIANSGTYVVRLNTPTAYGSGITQMADEIGRWVALGAVPNIPIMFVNVAVAGMTMTDWNNNAAIGNWTLLQFMAYMLAQAGGRSSALLRSVVVWSGTPAAAITAMNQVVANVEARLPNQPANYTFPVWVRGGARATRPYGNVATVRAACIALGQQGGRYRELTGPNIDIQMEAADNLHQATGAPSTVNNSATAHLQGNRRLGFRQGRGVAAMLQELLNVTPSIERFGPRIVSRQFVSTARTAFRVTWDRDTRMLESGLVAGIPQWWVSTDNRVTWNELTARKTGMRTFEIDHPTGDWQGQTVYVSYCRDSPWGSGDDTGATALLARLVYDAIDEGAGAEMAAYPSEGVVADAGVTYSTIAPGTGGVTLALTKAQLATLRVKDNGPRTLGTTSEPISLRWERKSGDLTGKPYDGINVAVTVA